jgi:hypothetical protein
MIRGVRVRRCPGWSTARVSHFGECRACQTLAEASQAIVLEVTAAGEGIRECHAWRAAC